MINTIIFDFDGTIADTFQSSIEIINSLADTYGFKKFKNEEISSLRSKSMRDIIRELHISFIKLPAIINDFISLAQKTIVSQHPFEKIPQLLDELNNHGYDVYIITTNSIENVTLFLDKHNVSSIKGIYSDKSLFGKHRVISKFLRKYRIKNEDAIYVGDEIRDIEAAHKAKIRIISVTWGYNSKDALLGKHPEYVVSHPKQILEILQTA